ncbi:MAG: hypothetical protein K9M94_15340 [Spirochaetia bacterium]|nr:hypothetical protein [Spirochaetia bacterium]
MITKIEFKPDSLESVLLLGMIWNGLIDEEPYTKIEKTLKSIMKGLIEMYRFEEGLPESKSKSLTASLSLSRYIMVLGDGEYKEFLINESDEGVLYAEFDPEKSNAELQQKFESHRLNE